MTSSKSKSYTRLIVCSANGIYFVIVRPHKRELSYQPADHGRSIRHSPEARLTPLPEASLPNVSAYHPIFLYDIEKVGRKTGLAWLLSNVDHPSSRPLRFQPSVTAGRHFRLDVSPSELHSHHSRQHDGSTQYRARRRRSQSARFRQSLRLLLLSLHEEAC
jgi:hypothetical protein